jgi:hypothetical protein
LRFYTCRDTLRILTLNDGLYAAPSFPNNPGNSCPGSLSRQRFAMKEVDQFTLETHGGPYETRPLVSRLFESGQATPAQLPGYVIEGAYRCGEGHLFITSWDCPFEESNDFTLLNEDYKIVATAGLGSMYTSYLLEKHWAISDHAIRLRYDTDIFYTLSVEPISRWAPLTPKLVLERKWAT